MKYIKIQNKGELDVLLITLMGGTTKANDKFKIGQFGTGLKYTLAYLLRNNIDFKILVGNREVQIETETEFARDTEFQVMIIDGKRTSITTNMGYDWQPWMILREVWCNALDEGEALVELSDKVEGEPGTTTIMIQAVGEIYEAYKGWNEYFMHTVEPLWENEKYAVWPNSTDETRIYKNGVLISRYKNTKSVFHYDIKSASINELREYTGYSEGDITLCLSEFDARCVEYFLENVKDEYWEAKMDLDFYSWKKFGAGWKEAVGDAKLISKKAKDSFEKRGIPIEEDAYFVVPDNIYKKLSASFPGIGALRSVDKGSQFFETFDLELNVRIERLEKRLEGFGYRVYPGATKTIGHFSDERVLARAKTEEKEVLYSVHLMDKTDEELSKIIIEEHEHLKTGFNDCSRSFQDHLFGLYYKQLTGEANEDND